MRTQQIPAELQGLIDLVEQQELILAQVDLPNVTAMPDYKQVLRVQDNNIALSCGYLKISPKRLLIHRENGEELDLNLPVPLWEKTLSDVSALVDEQGNRILVPTIYTEEVKVEVTPAVYDEEGILVTEAVYETETQEVKTEMEPVLVPTLKYLMLIISNKKYKDAFELFTHQFVNDELEINPNAFTTLK